MRERVTLDKQELAQLADLINQQLNEFNCGLHLSRGVVRVAFEEIYKWLMAHETPLPVPIQTLNGAAHLASHTNGNGAAKAHHRNDDAGRTDRRRKGEEVPKTQVIGELRRQAMAGVAPSMAAFGVASPATWPKAYVLIDRFGMTWGELVSEAVLQPNPRGARSGKVSEVAP